MKKHNRIIVYTVLVVLFGLRLINLEADVPAWGIAYYQPMDEGQYATMAINKYEYGTFFLDNVNKAFLTQGHIRNDIIGNVAVYLGMKLLGDNYYGLRSPMVFMGLLIFILFILNLELMDRREGKNGWMIKIAMAVWMLSDFGFTLACRTVETTLIRLLFLQLIITAFLIFDKYPLYHDKLRFAVMGCLAVISIFGVYITNIFIIPAIGITILAGGKWKGKEYLKNAAVYFIGGCLTGYIACDFYYGLAWHTSVINNTLSIVNDFSYAKGYERGTRFFDLCKIGIHFFSSNGFIYNIILTFLLGAGLPALIKKCLKEKNELFVLYMSMILCFFLQTLYTEDYIIRKSILILPVAMYLLYMSLDLSEDKSSVFGRIYRMVCMAACMGLVYYRFVHYNNGGENHAKLDYPDYMLIGGALLVIVVLIIGIMGLKWTKNTQKMVLIALFVTICTNMAITIPNVYANSSRMEKEVMTALGDRVGEAQVFGIYSVSFTLYNSVKPVVNTYEVMGKQMKKTPGKVYYLDYPEHDFPMDDMKLENRELPVIEDFSRGFSTFGEKKQVTLYEMDNPQKSIFTSKDVCVFGDDCAWGYTGDGFWPSEYNWPDTLHDTTKCHMVNNAAPGATLALLSGEENQEKNQGAFTVKADETDFSWYKYLFIAYGESDRDNLVPIGEAEDSDPHTFNGALNYSITHIKEKYPDLTIILVTPVYSDGIKPYVQTITEAGERFGLDVVDLYQGIAINEENYQEINTIEKYKVIGDYIASYPDYQFGKNGAIYLNALGGELENHYKILGDGLEYGILPVPYRQGYSFDGWYTEKEDGEKIKRTGIYYTDEGISVLYAHWRK